MLTRICRWLNVLAVCVSNSSNRGPHTVSANCGSRLLALALALAAWTSVCCPKGNIFGPRREEWRAGGQTMIRHDRGRSAQSRKFCIKTGLCCASWSCQSTSASGLPPIDGDEGRRTQCCETSGTVWCYARQVFPWCG